MLNENRMTVEEEVVTINANTELTTKKLTKSTVSQLVREIRAK